MKTVVIIGAGFSGTVLAAQLLQQNLEATRIVLVNRSGLMARGLAYGTNSVIHLLNVPAGNMSAYADQPDHFLNYCKLFDPATTGATFVSRKRYGEYLGFVLESAERQKKSTVTLERIDAEVAEIHHNSNRIAIKLSDGRFLEADHAVLALGNFSPADPLRLGALLGNEHYLLDPWSRIDNDGVIDLDESILLMGTGLTALDTVIKLVQRGHCGPIHMISRRGLSPLPHRKASTHPPVNKAFIDTMLQCQPSISNYLKIIRKEIASLQHTETDWRDIISAVRPVTATLWRSLDAGERSRFLRHLQPYWDIHRHRVAPMSFDFFEQSCASGQTSIIAGRIKRISLLKNRLIIDIKLRKNQDTSTIEVDRIINCTGPNTNVKWMNEPLIAQLIDSRLVKPDDHNLGVVVNDDLSLVNRHQNKTATLSYIGPMLKATFWEATAVPELRKYAAELAALLKLRLSR
ncbi:FAD/NAD(P)-binding protein [Pseudomonas farris]